MRVSPAAQNLATKLGVDVGQIIGSGPGGRIMVEDVRQAAGRPSNIAFVAESGLSAERVELSRMQRVAVDRMSASFRTAPHFYLNVQADVRQLVALRDELLPGVEVCTGLRLSFSDLLVVLTASALSEHRGLNSAFAEDHVDRYKEINIGLAVDSPHGLVVPVIQRADQSNLAEIVRRRSELVQKARQNHLALDEISGGTFTISNLGMYGIDSFDAIINPPQAAILATGRIAKRPVVVGDELAILPTMWLTLSVDHRVADGAAAARFLRTLVGYLEEPRPTLLQK